MSDIRDVRIVVGIDFGTTFSGFAYAHITDKNIITNNSWPDLIGQIKTNTVLSYDSERKKVESWGKPALVKNPKRKENSNVLVELFKLHLADIPEAEKQKYPLPPGITCKKAITDYLREMKKLIEDTVKTRWEGIDFTYQVLFVFSIPAEFPDDSKAILRKCARDAGLIYNLNTTKLQFTTEPEAAAIYCLDSVDKVDNFIGKSFLVVDIGGGTVDLTIRKLEGINKLSEETIRTGEFCGGIYVDREFIKFLGIKVGESAIEKLKNNHYGNYQYLILEFCKNIKFSFTGTKEHYSTYYLDIEEVCPVLKQYVTGPEMEALEKSEWVIELTFEDVKKMFDNVICQILRLIHGQLNMDKTCSTIFLVGGFSESKYLQKKIEDEFSDKHILVPQRPVAAVVRGAVKYGLDMKYITSRILKYTYGRSILRPYDEKSDSDERKRKSGQVLAFLPLVKKGAIIKTDYKFSQISIPEDSDQTAMWYQLLVTKKDDAKYPDEEGVKELGQCTIKLPDAHLGRERKVLSQLTFGTMEIQAYARNEYNNDEYRTTFEYRC